MAMRETVGSLRAYLIVVGLFGSVIYSMAVFGHGVGILGRIIATVCVVLSVAYIVVGIRLRQMLINSVQTVIAMLIASLTLTLVWFFLGLIAFWTNKFSNDPPSLLGLIISLLIYSYLLNSVKRLAKEQQTAPAPNTQ